MDRAFLIIPKRKTSQLPEALALAETAGYTVIRIWRTRYPNRVGRGLLNEIAFAAEEEKPDVIIFYGEPQPSTLFNLMKAAHTRVIDRVQLILEIFAKHAGSREAKLQIESARIRHEIPLIREFIRRSKMGELPGFLGPGTYAIDAYYRHLTSRLARIRRELERLRDIRARRRASRQEAGMVHIAIVGYASAGKTTLFNILTGLSRRVGPEYFTTLSPKHARIRVGKVDAVLIDTVGFIRDVPPTIIEAFHSTLEEVSDSDVIIFVVDISNDRSTIQCELSSGFEVLSKIGATRAPIIIAANKIDLLDEEVVSEKLACLKEFTARNPQVRAVIPISAARGDNVSLLLDAALGVLESGGTVESLREGLCVKVGSQAREG